MEYQSGAAFRRALEDRLRTRSIDSGTPLVRLRKMVAFERLLARLFKDQPDGWVLKGGLALQLRLGDRARTTKDVDLLHTVGREDARRTLARAAALDLGDWFEFEVTQPADEPPDLQAGGLRFPVHALLDGRTFEAFHVDVGQGNPLVEQPDLLSVSNLLDFAGVPETVGRWLRRSAPRSRQPPRTHYPTCCRTLPGHGRDLGLDRLDLAGLSVGCPGRRTVSKTSEVFPKRRIMRWSIMHRRNQDRTATHPAATCREPSRESAARGSETTRRRACPGHQGA